MIGGKCLLCRLPKFVRWVFGGFDRKYRIRYSELECVIESKGGGQGHFWRRVSQPLPTYADAVQHMAFLQAKFGGTLSPSVATTYFGVSK